METEMAYWHHNQFTDHRLAAAGNAAKILGQFLAGCMDDKDQWQMSRDRMKTKTGMSLSSISKALAELEDTGVIVGHRQGRRTSTQYLWAFSCPLECGEDSHRESVKKKKQKQFTRDDVRVQISDAPSESTEPHTTESTEPHTTEWSELLTTNTPVNKSVNKPIKKIIDPRDSGLTLLETFESELSALMDSGKAPNYETHKNYGDPLERLTLALQIDPDGMEKQLKKKTATAKYLGSFIRQILVINPHTLMPDDLYHEDLLSLENLVNGVDTEPVAMDPSEARTTPKTSSVGTSAPAPIKPAHRPPVFDGVSAPNMAWLGSHPTDYELRCAALADNLGLTIPQGVDAPQAGQLLAAARDMKAAGEVFEHPTSEQWQGRTPLKVHQVKVSD